MTRHLCGTRLHLFLIIVLVTLHKTESLILQTCKIRLLLIFSYFCGSNNKNYINIYFLFLAPNHGCIYSISINGTIFWIISSLHEVKMFINFVNIFIHDRISSFSFYNNFYHLKTDITIACLLIIVFRNIAIFCAWCETIILMWILSKLVFMQ